MHYKIKLIQLFTGVLTLSATFMGIADDRTTCKEIEKQCIYKTLEKVSKWQLERLNTDTYVFEGYEKDAHMSPANEGSHPQGWVYAALFVGMAQMAELASEKGDESYYKTLFDIAKNGRYLFGPRIYNADDYAIGQLYLDLYEKYEKEEIITPLKVVFDITLLSPPTVNLTFEEITQKSNVTDKQFVEHFGQRKFPYRPCKNRWCWADALFMGPPVWTHLAKVTGDNRYLDFSNKEFWATVDLLWDKEDHLFFRDTRFFDKREPNGEKVIWARGVGWVAAGLARILEHFPKDHPQRAGYEDIFSKMMTRLAGAQQSDGLWRPSVLAPDRQPFKETSGTALMAFAFASGINQGILDKDTFMPVVLNAWNALNDAVQPDGKLGWVQQIGHSPDKVSKDDTQMYAVGAFLLTGTELYKLAEK